MAVSEWDKRRKRSMEALLSDVMDEGGISVMQMSRLRDSAGWDKLGVNVVADIAKLLDQHGMGTLPVDAPLPLSQGSHVRVYSKGSRIGAIVDAVMNPSGQGDKVLREAGVNDAEDVLARVRMLVGE